MGKRAREQRRKAHRLAVIQGGKGGAGAHRALDVVESLFGEAVRRTEAIIASDAAPDVVAKEILDIFDGGAVPPSLVDAIHARSPARARAVAEAAMAASPDSEAALSVAVALAEIEGDAARVISLLEGRAPAHPELRVALGRALSVSQRIADAGEILEAVCTEVPFLGEAEEERCFAVIASHARLEAYDGKPWQCPCGSGRDYAACCMERERRIVERFEERSAFDEFRAQMFAFSLQPEFDRMRARVGSEWLGPDEAFDEESGEFRALVERSWQVLSARGEPGPADSVLERYAAAPGASPDDRRRARDWLVGARHGLWRRVTGAEPPGEHLEDLLTGTTHYVAVAPEQRVAFEANDAVLGLIVPFDGVWRTGAALFPMSLDEAHGIRRQLVRDVAVIARKEPNLRLGSLSLDDVAGMLDRIETLPPGLVPPEDVTPHEVSSFLSHSLAVWMPVILDRVQAGRTGSLVLTNTSGEPLELITARISLDDPAAARAALLARPDVYAEPGDPDHLVWEGEAMDPEVIAQMRDRLGEQGVEPPPDDGEPQRWVLAHARVEGDALAVEVNSRGRLERFLGILRELGARPRVVSQESTIPPGASAERADAYAWLHRAEPLPDVEVPDAGALARLAAGSMVLARVRALLELLGPKGRKLTKTGNLRLADARAFAEAIGEPFDEQIGHRVFRTRSAGEVRVIDETVEWARAGGLVRVANGWARPTKRAGGLGRDPLRDWWDLFEGFARKMRWPERRHGERDRRPWWGREVADLVPRLLEELYRARGEPVRAGVLAERVLDALRLRYNIPPQEGGRRWVADWIEGDIAYGIMRPLAEHGALALDEEPIEVGGKPTELTRVAGARATPLGLWAVRRLLGRQA